jgi:hypothetical protein
MLLLFSAALAFAFAPQQPPVSGTVFIDVNANATRDGGERGAAGVTVSNQEVVVVTDSAGAFQIPAGRSGVIFVSVPDGYRSVTRFWRSTSDRDMTFALQRTPVARAFTFVHASDPHLAPATVERTRRFRAVVDSIRPAFALITGDLVRDAMSQSDSLSRSYFDLVASEFRAFVTPLWLVPGNHDHFGIIRSRWQIDSTHALYGRGMYRHYFGPDYYSFTYGGVHFVALNTLMTDDSAYYGRVDQVQLEWLKRDLERLPRAMPVVTFNHIPLVSGYYNLEGYIELPPVSSVAKIDGKPVFRHTVSNVLQVLSALKEHPNLLALGGHTHAAEQLHFETTGMSIRFEQSAAIVGGGAADGFAIRSGFTVYRVRDGHIDAGEFVSLDPPARGKPDRK